MLNCFDAISLLIDFDSEKMRSSLVLMLDAKLSLEGDWRILMVLVVDPD